MPYGKYGMQVGQSTRRFIQHVEALATEPCTFLVLKIRLILRTLHDLHKCPTIPQCPRYKVLRVMQEF